jgi:hypothetical protein
MLIYSSTMLDIGISWKWSASRPCLFTPGDSLNRRLGGPHSQSGRCAKSKILPLPRIEHRHSNRKPVTIPTELSRLLISIGIRGIISYEMPVKPVIKITGMGRSLQETKLEKEKQKLEIF